MRTSIKVALVYFVISFLWIVLSDNILLSVFGYNPLMISRLQTIKGLVFILGSALVVYYLLNIEIGKRNLLINKAEKEKAHYLALFESANDAIFIIQQDKFIDCNHQATIILGCDKNRIINSPFLAFSPEFQPDGSPSASKLQKIFKSIGDNGQRRFEWRYKTFQNTEFDAEVSLNQINNAEFEYQIAIVRDISERKQYEKQILENQVFIQRVTEQSPDIIYIYDVVRKCNSYTNKNLLHLIGYDESDKINLDLDFFRNYMHPDDLIQFVEYEEYIQNWSHEFVFSFDYRLKAKNGDWRWFRGKEKEFQRENGKIVSIIGTVRDVTDEKIAGEKLRKSEEKLYKMFNNSQTLMVLYSAKDLKRLDVNKVYESISGYSKAEVLGKSLDQINFIKEIQEYKSFIANTIPNEQVQEMEFTLVSKDGLVKTLMISRQFLDFDTDSMILISGREITEQKKAERALKENQNRLDAIVNQAFDAMYLCDLEGNIIDVNDVSCQMLGYSRAEFLSMNIIQTDSRVTDRSVLQRLFQNLAKTKQVLIVSEHVKKNGERIPVEIQAGRINIDGKECFLGFVRDISQRLHNERAIKESEIKYKAIIENMSDGLVIVDTNGKILSVNPAYCKMHGIPEKELLQLNAKDIYHAENTKTLLDYKLELEKKGFFETEAREVHAEGITIYTNIRASKITIGQSDYYLAVVRDVTEKKELEKKMLKAIIETEEKERGRIAKDLHDGLGPVLSAIKLYNQWLNDPKTKTPKDYIFEKNTQTIDEAIVTLKEISANLSPHILRNFGLVYAIKSLIEKLGTINHLEVDFHSNLQDKLGEPLETTIYRIFAECFNNTIKYANASQVKFELLHRKNSLKFLYSDNGKGFDIQTELSRPSGFGLQNMINRVNSLKGKIEISSDLKFGTRLEAEFLL